MVTGKRNTTYHIEGHHRVHLDGAVEITEEDGNGQQKHIDRVADIVAQQLDPFAGEHPHIQCSHCLVM